jgi:hypothetical protein
MSASAAKANAAIPSSPIALFCGGKIFLDIQRSRFVQFPATAIGIKIQLPSVATAGNRR